MRLLILGGTVFVGRHLAEAALRRGHEVTLFNRGRDNPDLFPEAEKLRGDRTEENGLDALKNGRWDAAIDTCGYVPRLVRQSAGMLADAVGHYTFLSSISVYAGFEKLGIDESAPTGTLEDASVEEVTGETYGPLKALCERAVEEALPGRALHIRPGLIVGPHDPTDRFTYWPVRVARTSRQRDGGHDVLVPDAPDMPVQLIDARDLADWTLHQIETGRSGVYNATGPDYPLMLREVLQTGKDVSGSDARFVWADAAFLREREVAPWSDLPLWVPDAPEYAGFSAVNCRKAIADGLRFRPLADTIRDTLLWASDARPAGWHWRAGLTPERERELLAAWRESPERPPNPQ